MLDDRVLAFASAVDVGDELMVFLADDRGNLGQAVARNDAGLSDRLSERFALQLGRPIAAGNLRWADRPTNGGLEWVAFSAVENSLTALTVSAAGVRPNQWLGGSLRSAASVVDADTLAVEGRDVGDASFDEIAAWLPGAQVAWLRVDPRIWSIAAVHRLDALCRILQVGIAIDVPAGSLATPVTVLLQETVPTATLGRRLDARLMTMKSQKPVFSIGRSPV